MAVFYPSLNAGYVHTMSQPELIRPVARVTSPAEIDVFDPRNPRFSHTHFLYSYGNADKNLARRTQTEAWLFTPTPGRVGMADNGAYSSTDLAWGDDQALEAKFAEILSWQSAWADAFPAFDDAPWNTKKRDWDDCMKNTSRASDFWSANAPVGKKVGAGFHGRKGQKDSDLRDWADAVERDNFTIGFTKPDYLYDYLPIMLEKGYMQKWDQLHFFGNGNPKDAIEFEWLEAVLRKRGDVRNDFTLSYDATGAMRMAVRFNKIYLGFSPITLSYFWADVGSLIRNSEKYQKFADGCSNIQLTKGSGEFLDLLNAPELIVPLSNGKFGLDSLSNALVIAQNISVECAAMDFAKGLSKSLDPRKARFLGKTWGQLFRRLQNIEAAFVPENDPQQIRAELKKCGIH